MGKRRWAVAHTEGIEYNLPAPKIKRRRATDKYRPDYEAFCLLLKDAFSSKLSSFIKAHLKQESNSDGTILKQKLLQYKKVPPGTFESLDQQYGSYWAGNTIKRLKIDALHIFNNFIGQ